MKKSLPFIIIGVVLVGVIATVVLLARKGNGGATSSGSFAGTTPPGSTASQTGSQQPPASEAGLVRPNVKVSSPVVLEEFGDYQCPPCGLLFPDVKKIEAEYGD